MSKPEHTGERERSASLLKRQSKRIYASGLVLVFVSTLVPLITPLWAQQLSKSLGSCPGLLGFENSGRDVSEVLQRCIDDTEPGSLLQFPAGVVYTLSKPVKVHKPLELATAGVGKNSPACDSEGGPACTSFFLDPLTPHKEGVKETGTVFEVSSNQVTIRHLVIDGMGNLFAGGSNSCNQRALIRIRGSTSSVINKVVLKNNPCGDALDVRKSNLITIRDSSFTENGSRQGRSSGVRVSGSKAVNIVNNFFFDNSKFDVHVLSCQDCEVSKNVAWHSAKSSEPAFGAFRVVSGDVLISENLSDCSGTGCVADFIVGSLKHQTGKADSEIRLFGNVSLNPQTGFIFGRDAAVTLVDNFAVGGERECAGTRYFGFTKVPGAQVVTSGSRLRAHHIKETETSFTPILPEELARCTMTQTSSRKLPEPDGNEPSIQNALQFIFRHELSRPARQTEKKKFGKMLAAQQLTLEELVARARGLGTLFPTKKPAVAQNISPLRCFADFSQEKEQEVCVQQHGEDGIAGGDVRLPGLFGEALAGTVRAKGFVAQTTRVWPEGIVPYAIGPTIPAGIKSKIATAIATYNSLTPRTRVRFIPRTGQSNYIDFVYVPLGGMVCGDSNLGMASDGQKQLLRINSQAPVCASHLPATLLHEIGHALGLDHEHQRPDRDNFIKINFQNYSWSSSDYSIVKLPSSSRAGSPYDITSIMHYSSYSASKNRLPVFVTKNLGIIPSATALSQTDINTIANLYAEAAAPPPPPPPPPPPVPSPELSIARSSESPISFNVQYTVAPGIYEIKYSVLEGDDDFNRNRWTLSNLNWPAETSFIGTGSPAFLARQGPLGIAPTPQARCIAVRARAVQGLRFSDYTFVTLCGPLPPPPASPTLRLHESGLFDVQYQIPHGISHIEYAVLAPVPPSDAPKGESQAMPRLPSDMLSRLTWPSNSRLGGPDSRSALPTTGSIPLTLLPQAQCIAIRARTIQGSQSSEYTYETFCDPRMPEPAPIEPVVNYARISNTSSTAGQINYDIKPGPPYASIRYALVQGPHKLENLETAPWPVEQVFVPQNAISLRQSDSFAVSPWNERCVAVKLRVVVGTASGKFTYSKFTYSQACRD